MTKRTVPVLLALLVAALALLVAACGGSQPTTTSAPAAAPKAAAPTDAPKAPAPTEAPKAAPPAAAATSAPGAAAAPATGGAFKCNVSVDKPTTVSYLGNKFAVIEYFANQMKSCEQGNLKVNLDWLPSNERDQKANLVLSSSDTSYEIIQATDRNVYEWATNGWIMPLDDLIAKYKTQYKLDDIPDGVWEGGRINGKTYGFPIDLNSQVFFYRKDIYDKYNLKPPTTWAEAMDQFKLLAEKKETPYQYAATYAKGSDVGGEFARFLGSNGGKWFQGDTPQPSFGDAKGVEAAQMVKDLMKYMPPDVLTYNNDKVMIALQQGQVSAAVTYITRSKQMDDPSQSKVVGKIEYAPSPGFTKDGPTSSTLARDNYVIPAKTKVDPDTIFRVILEATSQASAKGAADLAMMPRAAVANDPEVIKNNRYLPAVTEAIKRGTIGTPKVPWLSLALTSIGNSLPDALSGNTSIDAALKQAANDYTTQAKDKGFIK